MTDDTFDSDTFDSDPFDAILGETTEPAMTAATDQQARSAFDRLRIDAAGVDVEAALAVQESPTSPAGADWRIGPDGTGTGTGASSVRWLAAAAIAVVALVGGFALLNRDGSTTLTTADGGVTLVPTAVPADVPPTNGSALAAGVDLNVDSGAWVLVFGRDVNGDVFLDDPSDGLITLRLGDEGIINGEVLCTPYGASYIDFRMSPVASEIDGCQPDSAAGLSVKSGFLETLAFTTTVEQTETQLRFTSDVGVLEFAPAGADVPVPTPLPAPADLVIGGPVLASYPVPGEWLLVHGEVDDGKVFFSGNPGPVTLEVLSGAVVGVSGCNTYRASVEEGIVGAIAATKKACFDTDGLDIMSVEAEYLRALAKVDTLVVEDTVLVLTGGGATLEYRSATIDSASVGSPGANDEDYKPDAEPAAGPELVPTALPTAIDELAMDALTFAMTATPWHLQFVIDEVSGLAEPAAVPVEVRFGDDGTLSWSAPCVGAMARWSFSSPLDSPPFLISVEDFVEGDPSACSAEEYAGSLEEFDVMVGLGFAAGTARLTDQTLEVDGPGFDLLFHRATSAIECGVIERTGGSDAPVGAMTTAILVSRIAVEPGANDCIRTVITLGQTGAEQPIMLAEDVDVVFADDGGIEVRFDPPGPDIEADFMTERTRNLSDGSAAVLASDAEGAFVYVNHGVGSTTYSVLENTAQIILETTRAPGGSALVTGAAILAEPLNADGPVTMPLTVSGYGIGFEGAQGIALFDAAGNPAVADWSGVFGGEVTSSEAGVSSGSYSYGPLSFTIDGLAPGDYELRWQGVAGPPEGPEFLQVEPFTVAG